MMRTLLILTACLAFVQTWAQKKVNLSDSQLNANLAFVLSYEGKVSKNQSFTLAAGIGYFFYYSTDDTNSRSTLSLYQLFTALTGITTRENE